MTGRVAMKAPTQVAGAMPRLMARRATLELNARYMMLGVAFSSTIELLGDLKNANSSGDCTNRA
jgi:hypothetical protein